jgi:aminopeptidase N
MIENFMTEEKFKDGVRSYLKAHQYGNAESKDLWASLTNFADLPENLTISTIMDTWTTQAGYPVVKFDGKTITQERFFLNASGKSMLFSLNFVTIIAEINGILLPKLF